MPPANHAKLSASSAHRWLVCPGSVSLSESFADSPSSAADEGTAAHALCEHKVKKAMKLRSKRPTSEYDSDEMESCTDDYRDFVMSIFNAEKERCPGTELLLEQQVDYSNYCPDGFGTCDCIIVSDSVLHIVDFKYGVGVFVEAERNPQMMLYALGAIGMFSALYDFKDIEMTIFQPRRENVATYKTTVKELINWAENVVKPKALEALSDHPSYHPSEDACRWCRASAVCRARAERNMSMLKYEFEMPPTLLDEEIPEILSQANHLKKWLADVEAYALDAAIHGKQWEGFKVVHGRSRTVVKDEEAVAKACHEAGYDDIYNKKMIGLTEMKKLLGKEVYKERIEPLTEKKPGSLTLVPDSDRRKAVEILDEFKEEK